DSWIKFPFQQRQQRVTHTVARVAGIEIGGVLSPWLAQSFEVSLNFSAAGGQQGPNQVLRFLRWSNTGQAACASSTKDSHKHGFRLIVERMRGGDLVCFALPDQAGKPLVA